MPAKAMKRIERTLRNRTVSDTQLGKIASQASKLSVEELSYLVRASSLRASTNLFRTLDTDTRLLVFQNLAPAYQRKLLSVLQGADITNLVQALAPDERAALASTA